MFEVDRKNNIKLVRGDSLYLTVTMANKTTGVVYTPTTGDVVRFALKKDYSDTNPLITKTIPNNTQLLELHPEDTKSLAFGTYVYDIELTKANGDVDTFINNVTFELLKEVY